MDSILSPGGTDFFAPFLARSKLLTRTISLKKGEMVYGDGEPSKYVAQIIRGAIRTYKELPDGRRQIIAFYLPGDIIGLTLGEFHCHAASAIFKTTLRSVNRKSLDRGAKLNAFVGNKLRKIQAQELKRAEDHLLLLGQRDAYEKVVAFLQEMDRRHPAMEMIPIPMTRRDIADYLGLTIETVARILTKLQDRQMLSFPITPWTMVVDRKRLSEVAK